MKNISYHELANCQNYAQKVVDFYKKCNKGKIPESASEAELVVREFNKEIRSFKSMFGYSIRGYISHIIKEIGLISEQ